MAEGLVVVRERDGSGGPLIDHLGGESICHVQPDTRIVLGHREPQEFGTLYITTRHLFWLSDHDPERGLSVDFLSLAMHAISRDANAYPLPCIYAQIESTGNDENEGGELLRQEEHWFDDLSRISELRLVPRDTSVLENIFRVLCECAALNPDMTNDLEGEAEWFYNVDELLTSNPECDNHSNHDLEEDPRFQDAEESEDDENF
ncbi:hypothetical protein O6H91_03G056700 [Diphasiastrum complanatum]|uniref:Uncharacterized protein n=1 Tax=Diphasiastrum complanatum TaxID=34168 RepID=A0ACC2E6F6_DIPCM|nr:hypothetical protein O6H91_03G056700 [Diphasiastrum complanatum]